MVNTLNLYNALSSPYRVLHFIHPLTHTRIEQGIELATHWLQDNPPNHSSTAATVNSLQVFKKKEKCSSQTNLK